KLSGAGSALRERAGGAKDSLADALQSGAEKLRSRGGDGSMSGAGAMGGSMAMSDDRMSQVTSRVAGGMEGAADWLRDAAFDGWRARPAGRTIAARRRGPVDRRPVAAPRPLLGRGAHRRHRERRHRAAVRATRTIHALTVGAGAG